MFFVSRHQSNLHNKALCSSHWHRDTHTQTDPKHCISIHFVCSDSCFCALSIQGPNAWLSQQPRLDRSKHLDFQMALCLLCWCHISLCNTKKKIKSMLWMSEKVHKFSPPLLTSSLLTSPHHEAGRQWHTFFSTSVSMVTPSHSLSSASTVVAVLLFFS